MSFIFSKIRILTGRDFLSVFSIKRSSLNLNTSNLYGHNIELRLGLVQELAKLCKCQFKEDCVTFDKTTCNILFKNTYLSFRT